MESLTIAAAVLGITQLVKNAGIVKGNWLQLVAVFIGGACSWLMLYQPEWWLLLENVLLAAGVTGTVSLAKHSVS